MVDGVLLSAGKNAPRGDDKAVHAAAGPACYNGERGQDGGGYTGLRRHRQVKTLGGGRVRHSILTVLRLLSF